MSIIRFEESLCHRCNLIKPTLRYCHEMYGGQFKQYFGWYIRQAFFMLGIDPSTWDYKYLPDICPKEYQEEIDALRIIKMEFISYRRRIMGVGIEQDPNKKDAFLKRENVRQKFTDLQRNADQAERAFTKKIENIVRKEFGFRAVGEGWVSETMLYNIVKQIFTDEEVIFHYRPDYLEGLELDVYIPSQKLAFEYQGQQHFHPIKAWGGEKALEELRARDARKAMICKEQGVKLFTVDYTEPLTEAHVQEILSQEIA